MLKPNFEKADGLGISNFLKLQNDFTTNWASMSNQLSMFKLHMYQYLKGHLKQILEGAGVKQIIIQGIFIFQLPFLGRFKIWHMSPHSSRGWVSQPPRLISQIIWICHFIVLLFDEICLGADDECLKSFVSSRGTPTSSTTTSVCSLI